MSRFGRFAATALLLAWAGSSHAEELFIRDATVYTLTDQGVIERGDVHIIDGKIEAVAADLDAPADARIIDGAGMHVTPGLVNSYTHIGIVEIDLVADTVDVSTEDTQFSASYRVAPALNPRSTLVPENRIHGVTHAVVAPESGHHVFAGQGAIVRLGEPASFTLRNSAAMFAAFGSGGGTLAGGSRAAAWSELRQSLLDAREFRDHRRAVMERRWRELSLPVNDLEALLPVINGEQVLVVTTHRASDISTMLELAAELDLKLVLAGASEGWMVADAIAAAGVPVIIDPMANIPAAFERLGARLDNAARMHAAGVKLLFAGVDFMGTHSAWLVRQAAGNAAAYGLPRLEAIRAMTLNPATVFGYADRFGSIAPGKTADLVIWDGDPLELLTQADSVIIDGEPIPMVSRATRLRDRYRDPRSNTPPSLRN